VPWNSHMLVLCWMDISHALYALSSGIMCKYTMHLVATVWLYQHS
jgi:hypothetical protein